jgi:predicted AAA+ superfamily ATPase
MISILTSSVVDQIFEDIKDDDEEEKFILVLTVEESQLTDVITLKELLNIVQDYADDFILFCEVTNTPSAAITNAI